MSGRRNRQHDIVGLHRPEVEQCSQWTFAVVVATYAQSSSRGESAVMAPFLSMHGDPSSG